ncbi:rhodanese-like domain-containing protein [Bizionia sediminis]|uniref:Rhodanese-like domain-containing protein n=1 Tax=Bizionia sediminis TaxID=1737064 RepID=A0ABW5KR16_9FLAO
MLHKISLLLFIGISFQNSWSQDSLAQLLSTYNKQNIPYWTVQELAQAEKKTFHLLDAREPEEFSVSHIKNALYVGYTDFNSNRILKTIPRKTDTLVVYCSLGVRSEKIAQKLKKAGYTTVYNLYGGIFEWKNNNNPVYNLHNKQTDSVHAFSKSWSTWLKNGIKVYN